MALKTTGKARVPREVQELADEGDEDAKALLKEDKEKKPAVPKSIAMMKMNEHFARLMARYEDCFVVDTSDLNGRPSTYTPEYCPLIVEAFGTSSVMLSERGLCARLGLTWGTWCTWKKRHTDFSASIEMGLALQKDNMTNVLVNDRINVAGLIMAMKNSAHKWKDKVEHDVGDNIVDLIRKAEQDKKAVRWQDIGSHGELQAKDKPKDVIDVEVTEEPAQSEGEQEAGSTEDAEVASA